MGSTYVPQPVPGMLAGAHLWHLPSSVTLQTLFSSIFSQKLGILSELFQHLIARCLAGPEARSRIILQGKAPRCRYSAERGERESVLSSCTKLLGNTTVFYQYCLKSQPQERLFAQNACIPMQVFSSCAPWEAAVWVSHIGDPAPLSS